MTDNFDPNFFMKLAQIDNFDETGIREMSFEVDEDELLVWTYKIYSFSFIYYVEGIGSIESGC